jgi:hypothetical protein
MQAHIAVGSDGPFNPLTHYAYILIHSRILQLQLMIIIIAPSIYAEKSQ